MLDTCNWGCLHIRITVDVLVVELSQRATLQACRPLPRLRQGEGEIKMEGTMEVSYAPRRYGSRYVGLVSERDAVQPSICIKDIGEFEFYFDGPTIRAFELLIQTLQESIPAMRAAGIE